MKPDRYVRKKMSIGNNLPRSTTTASNPNLEFTHLEDSSRRCCLKNFRNPSCPSSSTAAKSFTHLNLMVSQQCENSLNRKEKRFFFNNNSNNKRRSVLKNRAESDAYLHNCSSTDDCKRESFSSIENSTNSPYKSLKKGQLKMVVLAVKDRLMNKNLQKKDVCAKTAQDPERLSMTSIKKYHQRIEIFMESRCTVRSNTDLLGKILVEFSWRKSEFQKVLQRQISLNSTPQLTMTNRLINCQKELNTCMRYFLDVVTKDKLLMLPGSASILLDIVVKLLLIVNENSRTNRQSTNSHEETSHSQSELCVKLHDDAYHCLAELLKVADKLTFGDRSPNQIIDVKGQLKTLSNKLSDILTDLVGKCANSGQSSLRNEVGQSSQTPLIVESPERRSSLSSRASGSSGISDICPEELFPTSTQSKQNPAVSNGRCSSANYGSAKTTIQGRPPLPPELLIPNLNRHPESELSPRQDNKCPSVTDSADSALGSYQDGEIELRKVEDKILNLNYDEILTESCNSSAIYFKNNDNSQSPPKQPFFLCSTSTPIVQVADNVIDDHEVTSEEKEERVGDKVVKTTKITTRKIVKKTFVTTKEATFMANGSIDDLMNDPTISDFKVFDLVNLDGSNEAEFKLTETENLYVKNLNSSKLSENGDRMIDSYRENDEYQSQDSSDSNAVKRTLKREQKLLHQSCSVQSISKKALLNGKLLAEKKEFDAQNSLLMASKSDTFEDGILSETKGQGKIVQNGWSSKDKNWCTTEPDEKCRNQEKPKISGVLSYIQIFGHNEPLNETDFTAVSLASYVQMRDKWRSHEEAWHRKELNFQFGFNSANSSAFSSPKFDSSCNPRHGCSSINWTATPKSIASFEPQSSAIVTKGDDWSNSWTDIVKGATAPRTNKYDRDDLYNLIELLDMDERLKFPHRFIVTPNKVEMNEEKYLPFREQLGLPFVNYLDEPDVKRFLILNNKTETEDGPEIRGGPVDALIVYATNAGFSPKGFLYQEAFLSTYRTFISPFDLLIKLIYRYEKFFALSENGDSTAFVKAQEYNKIVKNTFSLIVCIVDDLSPADLTDNILCTLSDFLYRMIYCGQLNTGRYLRQRLTRRIEYKRDYSNSLELALIKHSSSPHPQVTSIRHTTKVTDFKSELLAEQFVHLDWYYFKRIELSEMLLWAQQQTEEHSPNLAAFTNHFNKMSYWVRTRILSCSDVRERECIFAKFLKVMQYLRQMNNFNSLFAMLSALDSGSIRRLDWPKALTETLSFYTPLTDSSQSFKAYRHALAETKPPCLPYIGIILQDLTFVHIGNPNLLTESQCDGRKDNINLMKRWQQHTILDNMRRFKAWPYNVKKNDQILTFLNDFDDHLIEEQLWLKSESIKPRSNRPKRNLN